MREKPYCDLAMYIMTDKAIMPTDARTPSRWHCQIEPVEVFDYHNRAEFIAACERAISRGLPEIPMPSDKEMYFDEQGRPAMREPVLFKYTKLTDWDELERKSIYVTVECYHRGFLVESWGHATDGKWSDDKLLELRLQPEIAIEGVVDALLDHLKSRRDLPGLVFDITPRTAKGA